MALRSCLGRLANHRSCASNNKSRYLNSYPKRMYTRQLSDFEHQIMTVKLHIEEIEKYEKVRNQLFKEYEENVNSLSSIVSKMKKLVESENVAEYDFETLKFEYKNKWLWMKNMHEAAHSIKGGTDFIKTYEENYCQIMDSEIGNKIANHPLVRANGHTGGTFIWTFYRLQSLYKNGWKKWLQNQTWNFKNGFFEF